MKSALIVGVSGQDGAYLAKLLLEKGYRVVGTSRDHELGRFENLKQLGIFDRVTLTSMAPNDFRSVYVAFTEFMPDEIYNLSGQSSVGLSFRQPMETFESIASAVFNMLECLRLMEHPARFFNAGSSECFGNIDVKANIKTAFSPRSPYAIAKAAAIWSVANYREAYGLPICSGILFNHESPIRPARFVTRKIVDAAVRIHGGSCERLQLGNLDISRDWGWAPDYVDAIWRMLQRDSCDMSDLLICTGISHSLQEFLELTFSFVGLHWRDHVSIDTTLKRPSDIENSLGCPKQAKEKLGWQATVGFREIVKNLIEASQKRHAYAI